MKNYIACGLAAATVFSLGCTPPNHEAVEINIDWVCDGSVDYPCDIVTDRKDGDIWNILNGADIDSITLTSGTFANMTGGSVGAITSASSTRRFDIKGVSLSGGVVEGDVTSNGGGSIRLGGTVELQGNIVANDSAQVILETANFNGTTGNGIDLNNKSRLYVTATGVTLSDAGGSNCTLTSKSIDLGILGSYGYKILEGGTGGECSLQGGNFGPVTVEADAETTVLVFPPMPFDISDYL